MENPTDKPVEIGYNRPLFTRIMRQLGKDMVKVDMSHNYRKDWNLKFKLSEGTEYVIMQTGFIIVGEGNLEEIVRRLARNKTIGEPIWHKFELPEGWKYGISDMGERLRLPTYAEHFPEGCHVRAEGGYSRSTILPTSFYVVLSGPETDRMFQRAVFPRIPVYDPFLHREIQVPISPLSEDKGLNDVLVSGCNDKGPIRVREKRSLGQRIKRLVTE